MVNKKIKKYNVEIFNEDTEEVDRIIGRNLIESKAEKKFVEGLGVCFIPYICRMVEVTSKRIENKMKYRPLPTIDLVEGLLLVAEVIKVGKLDVKTPKISDEMYMEVIKFAVSGDSK